MTKQGKMKSGGPLQPYKVEHGRKAQKIRFKWILRHTLLKVVLIFTCIYNKSGLYGTLQNSPSTINNTMVRVAEKNKFGVVKST